MSHLEITLAEKRTAFAPGETVRGSATWHLDGDPDSVEARLFWYTEGKGSQDVGVVATAAFEGPGRDDRRSFSLALPAGPLSFEGKLISLCWAVELVAEPGGEAARVDLLVTVGEHPIRLYPELAER